jgi:hypothetical protein
LSIHKGSISTANGSALVRLGSTTIVCGVKAEIAEPDLDRPNEGFLGVFSFYSLFLCAINIITRDSTILVPNLDLPAICSPRFKPGPPTEEAQVLSERLNEALVAFVAFPLSLLHNTDNDDAYNTAQTSSHSPPSAYTPKNHLGSSTSTRSASTTTVTHSMRHSSLWSLLLEIVRILPLSSLPLLFIDELT